MAIELQCVEIFLPSLCDDFGSPRLDGNSMYDIFIKVIHDADVLVDR